MRLGGRGGRNFPPSLQSLLAFTVNLCKIFTSACVLGSDANRMTGLLTFSATIGEFFIVPLLVGLVKPNLK